MDEHLQGLCHRFLSPIRRLTHANFLPDVLIIGAQKSGTSFLHRQLDRHADIKMARRFQREAGRWQLHNEIHYFDARYERGLRWYSSHFSLSPWQRCSRRGILFGEKTPKYLCDPRVPERVHRELPDAKLIVLLRNPVERAYSHYRMNARNKKLTASFEEVVNAEFMRWEGGARRLLETGQLEACENKVWNNLLARGLYVIQLRRWMQHFPREQFLIIRSEDLFDQPAALYEGVLEFLGVRKQRLTSFSSGKTEHPPMAPELRERLAGFFKPYNEALYAFLERDLGWD